MTTTISSTLLIPKTLPHSTPHTIEEIEDLKVSLANFLNDVPSEESSLEDDQIERAKELKKEALTYYTPGKLVQLYDIILQNNTKTEESPLHFHSLTDPYEKIKSLRLSCKAVKALECWKERDSKTGLLDFLKKLNDSGDIIWEQAPELPFFGIEALRIDLILHELQDKKADQKLAEEVRSNIDQTELKHYINDVKYVIEQIERRASILPKVVSEYVDMEDKEFKLALTNKLIGEEVALDVIELNHHMMEKGEKEKALEYLRTLYSFLSREKTEKLDKVLKGALYYFDHLVDKKRKSEGCPKDQLFNQNSENAPHPFCTIGYGACLVQ